MELGIISALTLPFLGTVLGAGCVFFMRGQMNRRLQRILTGFASGVMVAASIWSLIIPAIEQSEHLGKLSFLPAFAGVWGGFLFLLLLDKLIPHLHMNSDRPEGTPSNLGKSTMMVLAVALHNLPEGAIISMPLASNGMKRSRAFGYGVVSGVIEPIGAIVTILLAELLVPVLPFMLSFAAGAMLYVVVEELIPEMSEGEHSNIGTVFFAVGFTLMMMLDVALG